MKWKRLRKPIIGSVLHNLNFAGKLLYDEKVTQDIDAGFATVEESVIGRKKIDRG